MEYIHQVQSEVRLHLCLRKNYKHNPSITAMSVSRLSWFEHSDTCVLMDLCLFVDEDIFVASQPWWRFAWACMVILLLP